MKPRRAHQHPGCEFLYVLEGELDISHGESRHRLEAGDAVYFDSNTPHSYSNAGGLSAKALIVTLQGAAAVQASASATHNNGNKPKTLASGTANALRVRSIDEAGSQATQ